VAFAPTAPGADPGTLTITTNANNSPQTVTLGGTGIAPVAISPTSLSFAAQFEGTTSAAKTVTLTNEQNVPLMIPSVSITGANSSDFGVTTQCPNAWSVPANSQCTYSITFTPGGLGTRTATLSFADGVFGSPQTVALTGSGIAPVTVSPASITSFTALVGTTSTYKTITITNSDKAVPLLISSMQLSGDFIQSATTCPLTPAALAGGTSCTVSVEFEPTIGGVRSGQLQVYDDAASSPQVVSLSGTGTSPLTVTPASLTFTAQKIGTLSPPKNITLTNHEVQPETFTLTTAGNFTATSNCSSGMIAANSSCIISMVFAPSATATLGPLTGSLTIAHSAAIGSPLTVPLTGSASATNPVAAVSVVSPGAGAAGTIVPVVITGNGWTHFSASSAISFIDTNSSAIASGITVQSFTAISANQINATLVLAGPTTAVYGARNISVVTPLTGGGTETASLLSAFILADPNNAHTITGVTPAFGSQGQTLNVNLTAVGTNFVQGTTYANFGDGITVNYLTITDATDAQANITISNTAVINPTNYNSYRTITLVTGGEYATSSSMAFQIGPNNDTLLSVTPNSSGQGWNGTVSLTASGTHFLQDATQVSFTGGIIAGNVQVTSSTTATADIAVPSNAIVGLQNVTVSTGGEIATLANAFTVISTTPYLGSVTPSLGQQGQTLNVDIQGVNTKFTPGAIQANFTGTITVNSITVNSPTDVVVNISISQNANVGQITANLTSGPSGSAIVFPFTFTVAESSASIVSVTPSSVPQGGQLTIAVAGSNTNWLQGTTTAAFYPVPPYVIPAFNEVTINNATSASLAVAVPTNTPPGNYSFYMATGGQVVNSSITVIAATPTLMASPANGLQGSSFSVSFTGQFTHFSQAGTVPVISGEGVTLTNFTVTSLASATGTLTIAPTAPAGLRKITFTTGGEIVSTYFHVGAASLWMISPFQAPPSSTLDVAITGLNTHFASGTTQVLFGAQITVNSVTVFDATHLTANITTSYLNGSVLTASPAGWQQVYVNTGAEQVLGGFFVEGPTFVSVVPSSAAQGSTVDVTITGSLTNWVQGQTEAILGAGVTVKNLTITSPTTATATISVSPTAPVGGNSVVMITGSEIESGAGFTVTPSAAQILSILPPGCSVINSVLTCNGVSLPSGSLPWQVMQLQTSTLNIVGQDTHWLQGETSVSFGSGVAVDSLTVTSPTTATVQITVLSGSPVGYATLTTYTDGETVTLPQAIDIEQGFPTLLATTPSGAQQGNTLNLQILGRFTHWQQGVTTVSFNRDITVNAFTVVDSDSAIANITVSPLASIDLPYCLPLSQSSHTITVTTGTEQVSQPGTFCVTQGAAEITGVSPNIANQGSTVTVTVTGSATHFVQGETTANFGSGINVGNVTVTSPTSATVALSITTSAPSGFRTVTMTTLGEVASQLYGFTVGPSVATLTEAIPNQAEQSVQNLNVHVVGQYSNFSNLSTVTFGAGITVNSVSFTDATDLTANISIDPLSYTGVRTVTVTTPQVPCATLAGTVNACPPGATSGSEIISNNAFTIIQGPAIISQIAPATGNQGQDVVFTITGSATHWAQNFTQFWIPGAGSDLTINSVIINSPTSATVDLSISTTANLGPRSIFMVTNGESLTDRGAFVVSGGAPVITYLSPNYATPGTNSLEVTIHGISTTWTQGSPAVNFGPGITVNSTQVDDDTHIEAVINVDPAAQLGYRTVQVQTGTQILTGNFQVVAQAPAPTPSMWYYWPMSGLPGQTFTISFTGSYTHWDPNPTTGTQVSFGSGIQVNSFQVTSPTTAVANITITATQAQTNLFVFTTGTEVETVNFSVVVAQPTLSIVDPNSGMQGTQDLTVSIIGQYTTFDKTTTFTFGPGITVNGPPTILGPTIATQSISIGQEATLGASNVIATTEGTAVGGASFTVTPSLALISAITPNTALQGQTIQVEVTGQNTHWDSATIFQFGAGIVVTSAQVNSYTDATLKLTLPALATVGPTNASAQTAGEIANITNGFVVQAGTPLILSSGPGSVPQQGAVIFTILSQATHWLSNPPTVSYSSGILLTNVVVTGDNSLTVDGYVQPTTSVGWRNLTVSSGTQVLGLQNAVYVTPGPAVINSVLPSSADPGATLSVTIVGINTNWVQGITQLTFPGVQINSFTVNSTTSIIANITVGQSAPAGQVSVTATTLGEVATGTNVFTVTNAKLTATINITPYTVTYDGNPHTATGTATGVGGVNLNADLTLSGTTHTNAGTYTSDSWSFTDPNGIYAPASGTVSDTISKAVGTVNLGSLSQTYTGSPLSASATTIPSGMTVIFTYNGLSTVPTAAGNYTVVGTISNPNYIGSATGTLVISPATAAIHITPYTVAYDGNAHTASGMATGVGGANLNADLTLSGTTHTNAGTYASDSWSFTDPSGNYLPANGTVSDKITQATALINVTSYSVTYDGEEHTATATATGVGSVSLNVNDFTLTGTAHTNAGTYSSDAWSFTDPSGNYAPANGTVSDKINPATATINVTPYTVTYDGNPHTATATATGVGSVSLSVSDFTLTGTAHTNAGTYSSDAWSFADPNGNYAPANGAVSDKINPAAATINVTPYTVTFDGNPHTATGSAMGVGGANLNADLALSGTTHTSAGTYASDPWSFTDPSGNYAPANGTASDKINQAVATINVTPYTVTFDGNPHTATGSAMGVGGANLNADLALSGTTHTNAGTYASDGWSFSDPSGNYTPASGTVSDKINQAAATINVTPYTVTFDGNPHTATATATGVGGASLSVSDFTLTGTTHTNAGTYASDGWSFSDPSGNYTPASGTVSDKINQAAATINVTPYTVTYDGNPHTATATATGVGGASLSVSDFTLTGTTHTSAGTFASDPWSFADPSGNYASANGTISDTINPVVPTLTFASIPTHTYGDAPFQVTATDAANTPSSGAITYSLTIGPISSGTVTSAGMVTLTGAGVVYLTASQAASGNYAAATATTSFTVNQEVPTLTFASIPTHTYGDASFQVTATDAANTPSSGMITYSLTNGHTSSGTVTSWGMVTLTGAGTVYLTASQAASGNYAAATATTSFTVNPALIITTTSPLPSGVVGTSYSQTLTATGGTGVYTSWAVIVNNSGLANLGLSLTSNSGVWSISGSSSSLVAGSATFTVQVTDSIGATTTQQLTINVYEPLALPAPNPASLGSAMASQYYNGSISGSGGSGNYSWSVTGLSATSLSYNPTGNPLTISGTAPATAQTLTLNVTMTDTTTGNLITRSGYTIAVINPNAGYPVSGTVTYSGSQTGWIYLRLNNTNCNGNCSNLGTAIPAPGAFTIQGVPSGTYTVQAYMDNLGFGAENASNAVSSSINPVSVTVTSTAANTGPIPLSDPGAVSLGSATPTWDGSNGSGAFNGGAFVYFDPICSGNGCNNGGIEMPASYTVQWSTSSSFGAVAGSQCFPATGSQNPWIVSGVPNGGPYYFRAAGNVGACGSSTTGLTWSTASPAMTIGAPSGGNLVQGTVTFSAPTGGITGPLYVGFYDQSTGIIYATVVGSKLNPPTSPAPYSVYVPTGSNYYFFGLIDQNNNGLMVPGDISNTSLQTNASVDIDPSIPSTLTQNLTLPSANGAPTNSQAIVRTQSNQQTNLSGNISYGYSVDIRVNGLYKLPASVDLYSGPSYIANAPADIATQAFNGYNNEFEYWLSTYGSMPSTSDVFTLNVTYTDGTSNSTANTPSNPLAASPTAVLSAWTTNMSPTWNTGSASTQPTFTWNYPANAGNYTYQFQLQDSNGNTIWSIPSQNSHSNGFTSSVPPTITWGVDPTGGGSTPSVTSLNPNSTYTWSITAYDSNNNEATTQVNFQTGEAPLTLPVSGALGSGTVHQTYNSSITATGGSGTGYSFTVGVNGAGATSGTSWTLSDGLSASSSGGTLTISGTPTTAPATITLAVGVTDSENHTASGAYTITIVSSQVVFPASGNVSYRGSKTGWVYLSLTPTNNCNNIGCNNPNPGTAISSASLASGGAFMIHGVQPGTYNLKAWMDILGYGVGNVSDPSGSTSVTVTNSILSGASVTLSDPGTVTLSSAPKWTPDEGYGVFSGGAIVYFSSILNNNNIQIPTSYILEYSTDSTFSTGVSSMSFPAAHGDHHWIVTGLANGNTYYFRAAGVVGSGSSAVTGPWSAASPSSGLTIGAPSGSNTVQGTVTFSQAPTGPLYVAFLDNDTNIIYTEEIASPLSPQAYSINLPNSSNYGFFAILDQNNAGWNAPGDVSNYGGNGPAPVSVTGSMSGVNLTLPSGNSFDTLTTGNSTQIYNYGSLGTQTYNSYNLFNAIEPLGKRPVAVELISGPNVVAPEDFAACGYCNTLSKFYFTFNPTAAPTAGDSYVFQVTYSDGTSETLSPKVSGLVGVPTNLSPTGPGSNTTPTFTWTDPANASSYLYQFGLQDDIGNTLWWVGTGWGGFPSTTTQLNWGTNPAGNTSPAPTVSSLTPGMTYNWWVEAVDSNGNWGQTYVDYVPDYTALALPTPNPSTLGTAVAGQSYNGTIVVTGGYGPYYWSVNNCQWDCTSISLGEGLTASFTTPDDNTLTISGTPTGTSPVSFQVYVYDSTWSTPTATYTYTINVNENPLTLPASGPLNSANVNQQYYAYINASGGSGSGYVWSINGAQVPTDGVTALALTDGLSAYSSGGTTLTISGTPGNTPQTITLNNVSVTDSANDTVTPATYTIMVVNPNAAYAVSGTVSYSGPDTGWVYLELVNTNCSSCDGNPGTAISGPGTYTIRGVQPGTYTLRAWMDNTSTDPTSGEVMGGYGNQNASNPAGAGASNVVVSTGPVTTADVTLLPASTASLGSSTPTWNPSNGGFGVFSGGAFVYFDPITNNNGIEIPNSYIVQWSANTSFSPVAGSQCFPATGSQNPWIVSGISGTGPYYFRAAGVLGSCASGTVGNYSAPSGAITITAPSSGYLVQGTVTFAGAATGPLYVGFYDESSGNIYVDAVGSKASPPASGVSYSVYVPAGSSYMNFGVIDQNNNGLMVPGDISNTNEQLSAVTVITGATSVGNLALPSNTAGTAPLNALASVRTNSYQQTNLSGNVSYGYNVGLRVNGLYKLPASVFLKSAPSYVTDGHVDIATGAFNSNADEWDYWPSTNGGTPSTSDIFTFNVTYTDGTSNSTANTTPNPLTASPTGVLTAWTTSMSPTWNTATVSTQPTFSWSYPSNAGNYVYKFQLRDSNESTIWSIPSQNAHSNGFSSSITPSITWGVDPTGGGNTPTVSSLNSNSTYTWQIQVTDANGNEAITQVSFQTPEAPLSLPSSGTVSAIINSPFSDSLKASGGSGSGYVFTVNSQTVPNNPSSLSLSDGLSASSSGNTLTISGTPIVAETITLAVMVTDSASRTAGPVTYYINVVNALSGVNNGNLKGTYVCKIDGYYDRNNARWASIASFQVDGTNTGGLGNFTNGVFDSNSRNDSTAVSGTASGTYSIGADNNGLMTFNAVLTSGATGSQTTQWAIALTNATSPAQEFRMIETDDLGASRSGQTGTGDCLLATTGTFATSTIDGKSFAFGLQGEDASGLPEAWVGRFTASTVSPTGGTGGAPGGSIANGISDGMYIKKSSDGGNVFTGSYTAPNSTTGRFTFATTQTISGVQYTGSYAGYIVDANRMFLLETVGDGGMQSGDMRTQQQASYSAANLAGPFVLYMLAYDGYSNGTVSGYDSSVFQGTGDGSGGMTINQSYDDNNGTYKVGKENGGPIAATFDSSNPGRATFSAGSAAAYLYFFDNNSAFFIDFSGNNGGYLEPGWMEPQTQTTFTNAAVAGNYLFGQLPRIEPTSNGNVGEFYLSNSGGLTANVTTAGVGDFTWDQSMTGGTYSWDTTATGTGSFLTGGHLSGISCVVISPTKAACIFNTDDSPSVEILQQ
jgi:hypothetical protein